MKIAILKTKFDLWDIFPSINKIKCMDIPMRLKTQLNFWVLYIL